MGEGTKRSNAKSYRQQLAVVGTEGTFGGGLAGALPVVEEIVLSCKHIPGTPNPTVGGRVDLIDRGQPAVEVFYTAQKIGYVGSAGTTILRTELKIQELPSKHLTGTITKVNLTLGSFTVLLSNY